MQSKSFVLYKYISTIFTKLIFQHCVGLMYKTGKLEVTADVRAKPLGQKRKRGRPAKIPLCLARSPPNKDTLPATALPAEVPILVLSPSVPSIASSSQSPSIVSHLTPAPLVRSTRCRRKVFVAEHGTEALSIRPAKRKGNFVEPSSRVTRSKKNID